MNKLMLGSRGSQLALWQTEWVKSELEKKFPKLSIEIQIIKTTGDKILDSPLSKIGDKGLFTREIEQAMLEKKIDAAVHSLKDLPTQLPEGLCIGAVSKREDVRDVFIANKEKCYKHFEDLPQNAIVATSSLRRKSQLLAWRPDLQIVDIRGNLNTRLAKLDESDWDGMLLARAGVVRLGFNERITEELPLEKMLPAVGQGALAIEIRQNDKQVTEIIESLNSQPTFISTSGERALLRSLEGGCQIPIGAYGRIEDNIFYLDALIGSLDGKKIVRGKIHGNPDDSEKLGEQLAKTLYDGGGREILESIRSLVNSH
ncbi:MAG: hydroxymethylbilane synthase [Ignavibacteriae bacterium]|nr:hydroxymethylbilane synthase [Ignavibacteriota bacterium]